MSRHYKPGDSEDFDFVRSVIDSVQSGNPLDWGSEANDDPSDDIEDHDAPEDDDDRAGTL